MQGVEWQESGTRIKKQIGLFVMRGALEDYKLSRVVGSLCLFASPRSNDSIDSRRTRWLASDQKGSGFSVTTSNGRRRRITDWRRNSRTALVRSRPALAKRASASLRKLESMRICKVDVFIIRSFVVETKDIVSQMYLNCNGRALP